MTDQIAARYEGTEPFPDVGAPPRTFSDRPGDPHSPYRYGTSLSGQLRGLAHAHVGWLPRDDPTPAARYCTPTPMT